MRIAVAGSSGFLGTHLVSALRARGHQPIPLVRRPPKVGEVQWDPASERLDPAVLDGIDVVINLAGSPTAGNPHSKKWATELRQSRVRTTAVLARAIAESADKPAFLAGNGISFYGDHGSDYVDEHSADSRGEALLTQVARDWQAATEPAQVSGSRVVILRTSPVLDAHSPPLKQLRLLFKAGLGGRLGSGRQYFPVISLRDWVGAVCHLVESDVEGPANLCCPQVPTNAEFTRALADRLGRPAFLAVPSVALKVAAGPMAPEVLGSVRARPQVLLEDGFDFTDHDVTEVLAAALG